MRVSNKFTLLAHFVALQVVTLQVVTLQVVALQVREGFGSLRRRFRDSPAFTKWNLARVLAIGALIAISGAMYSDMTSASVPETLSQADQFENLSANSQPQKLAKRANQLTAGPGEAVWVKVDWRVVDGKYTAPTSPLEYPWQESDLDVVAQRTLRRELTQRGLASFEGGRFQASVAEAADAGAGRLLLEAGFTRQQIRNAQEQQRNTYEEAGDQEWFHHRASLMSLGELRRRGFADYLGNVNVAAARAAGFGDLLLQLGLAEGQAELWALTADTKP